MYSFEELGQLWSIA